MNGILLRIFAHHIILLMNDIFSKTKDQIIQTVVILIILLVIRFVITKFVRKIGDRENFNDARTRLIIKYVNISVIIIALFLAGITWSVKFKDIEFIFSSVFAVLGVALFAQWSILSNVTAGVILFFSFPFKIGDRVRIQDKDFPSEAVIEDIKAFHVHLRTDSGELITYPNNLMLQKGIVVLHLKQDDEGKETL